MKPFKALFTAAVTALLFFGVGFDSLAQCPWEGYQYNVGITVKRKDGTEWKCQCDDPKVKDYERCFKASWVEVKSPVRTGGGNGGPPPPPPPHSTRLRDNPSPDYVRQYFGFATLTFGSTYANFEGILSDQKDKIYKYSNRNSEAKSFSVGYRLVKKYLNFEYFLNEIGWENNRDYWGNSSKVFFDFYQEKLFRTAILLEVKDFNAYDQLLRSFGKDPTNFSNNIYWTDSYNYYVIEKSSGFLPPLPGSVDADVRLTIIIGRRGTEHYGGDEWYGKFAEFQPIGASNPYKMQLHDGETLNLSVTFDANRANAVTLYYGSNILFNTNNVDPLSKTFSTSDRSEPGYYMNLSLHPVYKTVSDGNHPWNNSRAMILNHYYDKQTRVRYMVIGCDDSGGSDTDYNDMVITLKWTNYNLQSRGETAASYPPPIPK